jgi:hypothetical protein
MDTKLKMGKYRHYKNPSHIYEVLGIARHSETLEELVVYKSLYDKSYHGGSYPTGSLWVRPLGMFLETVIIDGKEIKRFEYIGE